MISLILEHENTSSFYTKFLKKEKYTINSTIILSDKDVHIEDRLTIIDINQHSSLELLKNITFKDSSYVIIIAPFSSKYMKVPSSIKLTRYFFLTKPINIRRLTNIIHDCTEDIQRNAFLKNKQNALIHSVDDAPFRVALYNLDGSLSYANEPYIEANNIEDIDTVSFDSIKQCKIEFSDILYNLKIKKVFTQEQKQGEKWYKSYFYMTEHNSVVVHFCLDQTQEKTYLESLKKSAQYFDQTNDAVLLTNKSGVMLSVNTSFCLITGYTKDEAIGKKVNLLKSGQHDKYFYEDMWSSLLHRGEWQGEIWNKRKNGEIYPEWLSITKLTDPTTKEITYMGIFTDISSLKEKDEKLHFYANHDHLTGLFNKVQFENMLKQTIESAVRNNKKFALLFIDLDYFKDVNDTAGHNIGDLVLKEVAARLRKVLRKEDILARIGGDEFNIIIDNVEEDSDVIVLANKLNEAIQKVFLFDKKSFYLSLSVGIAIFPYHGLNSNELSKNADSAMYEVKKAGRNGVLLYNKKFTDDLLTKVTLHNDLKNAIENEDFNVHYQLVVDMQKETIVGAEALVRWQHHTKGSISPEEFIPVAEHHGLIFDIGKYVYKTICEDLPQLLHKFGQDFVLAFNVSTQEFSSDNYLEDLISMQKDFNISPKNLEIEITETLLMKDQTVAIEKMKKLRELGFNIAIDDFGTGYSSLSYLKKFPINKIKIDKSFIDDILIDADDLDMVEAMINIAKIFHLEVQAEGVEDMEELLILKNFGADIAQGYLFSKPAPLNEIISQEWKVSI